MFGRKNEKAQPEPAVEPVEEKDPEPSVSSNYTPPKGRPTPSRKEREATRRQPLVVTDRKAAKAAEREAAAQLRQRQAEALRTGDERYLPAQHRGKQRRFIRDYVDARHNLGDYLMYVLLACVILGLFVSGIPLGFASHTYPVAMIVMYSYLLLTVIDLWFLWRKLKRTLNDVFGEVQRGSLSYVIGRVVTLNRRFRQPKPQVKYGEYPR